MKILDDRLPKWYSPRHSVQDIFFAWIFFLGKGTSYIEHIIPIPTEVLKDIYERRRNSVRVRSQISDDLLTHAELIMEAPCQLEHEIDRGIAARLEQRQHCQDRWKRR